MNKKYLTWALISAGMIIFLVATNLWWVKRPLSHLVDSQDDCGFEVGPYAGERIAIDRSVVQIEEFVDFPGGKFGFIHMRDTLTPVLIKLNEADRVLWAIRLNSDNRENWIPLKAISDIRLSGHTIFFHNLTHTKPGKILLTREYDFKFMCLSPM